MNAAVTINFRQPSLTVDCVESLLMDGWYPVVVWDNSGDQGRSILALEAKLAGRAGVHLVASSVNLGFAAGMNQALAYLAHQGYKGPVLLINNDTQVRAGLLEAMQRRLAVTPSPALIAPRVEQARRTQEWMYYQPWFGLVSERPMWGSFPYLSGCCLLVCREHNDRPLFDESFFMYGEDVELSWRFANGGHCLELLRDGCVSHLGSASSGEATAFYERHVTRGHWLLAGKLHTTVASKVLMRLLRLPVLTARACVRTIRLRSGEPLKALFWLIR